VIKHLPQNILPDVTLLIAFVVLLSLRCAACPIAERVENRGLPGQLKAVDTRSIDDLFLEVARRVPAFGGMYLGPDKTLQVYLLNVDPATIKASEEAITAVFGRERIPAGTLHPLKGQFGFQQLKDWHDRARDVLGIPGVVFSDIDERMNRLTFGLNQMEAREDAEKLLIKLQIPKEAVIFQKTSTHEPEQNVTTVQDLQSFNRPLIGGLQIRQSAGFCTLSFVAIRGGVPGFLTCSHCTSIQGALDGTIFFQPTGSNANLIGTETVDPAFFTGGSCPSGRQCRMSDVAFIAMSPGVTAHPGELARLDPNFPFPFKIKSISGLAFEGQSLSKVGRTTGWTGGEVSETCVDINSTKDSITMLCQTMVDALSAPGDSGSPVFINSSDPYNYNVSLYGILWGGATDGSHFDVSHIGWILQELPLDAIVFDLPPKVQIISPSNGAKVPYGAFSETNFLASVTDFEDGPSCCSIKWSSDKDGPLGTGAFIQYEVPSPGNRTVTVTAKELQGPNTSKASVVIGTTNSPPKIWIVTPKQNQTLYRGMTYIFQGGSWDSETFSSLPCQKLLWSSPGTPIGFGCSPSAVFATNGLHYVKLTGTDPGGETGGAAVIVNVVDPPLNSPPVVAILSPPDGSWVNPGGPVTIKGTAKDPDGKNPLGYKWTLTGGPTLGSGTMNNGDTTSIQWGANLPFSCGGNKGEIVLSVTDADGQTASASITLYVSYPPC
jgi:hypothetical protein